MDKTATPTSTAAPQNTKAWVRDIVGKFNNIDIVVVAGGLFLYYSIIGAWYISAPFLLGVMHSSLLISIVYKYQYQSKCFPLDFFIHAFSLFFALVALLAPSSVSQIAQDNSIYFPIIFMLIAFVCLSLKLYCAESGDNSRAAAVCGALCGTTFALILFKIYQQVSNDHQYFSNLMEKFSPPPPPTTISNDQLLFRNIILEKYTSK